MSLKVTVKFQTASFALRSEQAWEHIRPDIKHQIIKDCNANVPMKSGFLRHTAERWESLANDLIVWGDGIPYAHFQYIGKVMIGEYSHSPFARKNEKKIYTDRDLTYSRGGSHWIEKTMAQRMPVWKKLLAIKLAEEFNRS